MARRIGLLGGSFNPAHEGHLHISEIARKKLGLDQVWWLVSPQNPLKSSTDMMSFEKRFESAHMVRKNNPKIYISDIESKLNTVYTIDILEKLNAKYPDIKFYWLMGTDNLMQFTRWKNWQDLHKYAEIHVFDRGDTAYQAIGSRAFMHGHVIYNRIRRNPLSSTNLRKSFGVDFPAKGV